MKQIVSNTYFTAAVEGLAAEAGQDGIGLDEAGEFGVVVAGVVVVEAGVFVDDLAGIVRHRRSEGGAFFLVVFFAEGAIAVVLDDIAVAVGHDGGGAEVVGMVVIEDGVENRRGSEELLGYRREDEGSDQSRNQNLACGMAEIEGVGVGVEREDEPSVDRPRGLAVFCRSDPGR